MVANTDMTRYASTEFINESVFLLATKQKQNTSFTINSGTAFLLPFVGNVFPIFYESKICEKYGNSWLVVSVNFVPV